MTSALRTYMAVCLLSKLFMMHLFLIVVGRDWGLRSAHTDAHRASSMKSRQLQLLT